LAKGKVDVVAPARVKSFAAEGLLLENGDRVGADAVVLTTGYTSSWEKLFDGDALTF
jgi:DNA-binding transcriptional MocR family regulator